MGTSTAAMGQDSLRTPGENTLVPSYHGDFDKYRLFKMLSTHLQQGGHSSTIQEVSVLLRQFAQHTDTAELVSFSGYKMEDKDLPCRTSWACFSGGCSVVGRRGIIAPLPIGWSSKSQKDVKLARTEPLSACTRANERTALMGGASQRPGVLSETGAFVFASEIRT